MHDDRRVGDLDQRALGRRLRPSGVDDARNRSVAQRDRQRGAGLGLGERRERSGARAPGHERDAGGGLHGQAVERIGGRLGTGGQPVGQPGFGIGAEAEDRGLVAREIGETDADRAGRARPRTRRRARTYRTRPSGTTVRRAPE